MIEELSKRIEEQRMLLAGICCPSRNVNTATLESVLSLGIEIAREGREGRKIGTMFIISDTEETLKHSRPLILDPLYGHPDSLKRADDPNMRETVKELAQMDGAFIVSDDGVFVSACRYIFPASQDIDLPLGFGSRHLAGASITKKTNSVAVVVSESSMVRVFDNGMVVGEIIPELWLLREYSANRNGALAGGAAS